MSQSLNPPFVPLTKLPSVDFLMSAVHSRGSLMGRFTVHDTASVFDFVATVDLMASLRYPMLDGDLLERVPLELWIFRLHIYKEDLSSEFRERYGELTNSWVVCATNCPRGILVPELEPNDEAGMVSPDGPIYDLIGEEPITYEYLAGVSEAVDVVTRSMVTIMP